MGKGEIACMEQFLTAFSTLSEKFPPFSSKSKLSSLNSFGLEESRILPFGEGLNHILPLANEHLFAESVEQDQLTTVKKMC